jgi:hypothetical protein
MAAANLQLLVSIADRAEAAGHGKKEAVYRQACEQLGISRATLMKQLKQAGVMKQRKRRADAGQTALNRNEAEIISGYLIEGYRKNNRKITSLKQAIQVLRDNGEIIAGRIDTQTGEIIPLSDAAISRALKAYNLHPEQLRRATPHQNLKSKHPNHVWQIDASVCVLYYLPDAGLAELDAAVHYKNKPENLKKIEQYRVIRYVLTDHATGLVRFRYYPHAESGEHTVHFMAWAMAPKADDPFNGVPEIVMVDPGATSGGLVKRFCQRMGIKLIVNQVHNARAKGSVEKGNHLVETTFEQALRYRGKTPRNFDELNTLAWKFQKHWNRTAIHSRHGKTRMDAWLTISSEQLKTTPSMDILLQLATREPESRKVAGDLSISFKGRKWSVKQVPQVMVDETVMVHWHPFIADTAMAVIIDEDGHEQHIALGEIQQNALGFDEDAAVIGEAHKSPADTIADTHRKQVQKLAAGTDTQEATDKKRKNKHYKPFDGRIDPLIELKKELPPLIHRAGRKADLPRVTQQLQRKNHTQMAIWLRGRLGDAWQPARMAEIKRQYPDGATEPELEQILAELAENPRPKLRAI